VNGSPTEPAGLSPQSAADAVANGPVLARLAATPLRDLLRGRLSGRLDLRRYLARAGLPPALANLTIAATKATRLWRLERIDVARELAAHFRDGLDAGVSAEQLAQDFGNPATAGRLIGRAKRRGRSAAVRALLFAIRAAGLLVILLVLAYAVLAIRFFTGHPTIARNYAAERSAQLPSVPESEKAWPLYRDFSLAQGVLLTGVSERWPLQQPGDPDWPAAKDYLAANARALALAQAAASKPVLGARLSDAPDPVLEAAVAAGREGYAPNTSGGTENPMLVSILFPHLGPMRAAARLVYCDATDAAAAGDAPRVWTDLNAILNMAVHAREQSILISDLVALAILTLDLRAVEQVTRNHPDLLTVAQLTDLAHRLAAFGDGRPLIRFDGERDMFQDVLQRTYTDDGRGDGRMTPEGLKLLSAIGSSSVAADAPNAFLAAAGPLMGAASASRRELSRTYDYLISDAIARVVTPMWEWGDSISGEVQRIESSGALARSRYEAILILAPAFDNAALTAQRALQERDAALTAIALELHRRRAGAYPATLGDLVPRSLPAVPPDRFDGGPLKYRLVDGKPLLYSVGVDRIDDGGRPPAPDPRGSLVSSWRPPESVPTLLADPAEGARYSGDWILYPVPRPRPVESQ
jgi:hypothetical protein